MPKFETKAHRIEGRRSPGRIAVLTMDVEYDYGGDGTEALDRLPEVVAAVRGAGLPLSAFVEGRLFRERPDLVEGLAESGADLHLHCYDHRAPGDDAASLAESASIYSRFLGKAPRGYRAKNYGLTEEVFGALRSLGFAWDSSILPGIGHGARRERVFRSADWFVFDDALAELPVASWRRSGIPFTQPYRCLMGRRVESWFHAAAGLPDLLIYAMHLVDLVPDGRIGRSPGPLWLKAAQLLSRRGQRGFADFPELGERLAGRGYRFTTMTECHERLTGAGR